MKLDNFGKNLKFELSKKSKLSDEKKIFNDIINSLVYSKDRSMNALSLQIYLLDYDEIYLNIIEDLILLKYGEWRTDIIFWYIYERTDEDGKIYPLLVEQENGEEDEEVIISNPDELWDFLEMEINEK